ncbi:MAG: hypothetical protein GY817_08240 [bacterium]|nr:hypothetical protein [bacterium]
MKKIYILCLVLVITFSNLFSIYKELDLGEINGYNMALRSAVYPGLGQLYLGEKSKGYFFSGLASLSIIGAIYSWNNTEKKYNEYESKGVRSDSLYDDYLDEMNQMYLFVGVGLLNWAYSIYDAYKLGEEVRYARDIDKSISMFIRDGNFYIAYNKRI